MMSKDKQLFLVFANDLQHVAKSLDPITFAGNTNLFYLSSDITELFEKVNKEPTSTINWCFVNKQSVYTSKA